MGFAIEIRMNRKLISFIFTIIIDREVVRERVRETVLV